MRQLRLLTLLASLFLLAFGVNNTAVANTRHAFIVGINDYHGDNVLQNAINDAQEYGRILSALEWRVVPVIDPNRETFFNRLHKFASLVENGDTVIFIFVGHGLITDEDMFLGPADSAFQAQAMA
ncbi:MAG: caspase family protein, partial [Pseudomonadota bacterium]